MQTRIFLTVAAFGLATTALAQPQWKHVGSFGQRHLVVVAPAAAGDAELLRQAAATTCNGDKPCVVAFWVAGSDVPTTMPMSRSQQQAMVAQYLRNPASGQEELLLRCGDADPAGAKCLR